MKNDRFIFLLGEDDGEHVEFAWLEIKQYSETVFKKLTSQFMFIK